VQNRTQMKLNIIIPTYNRALSDKPREMEFEVAVIDNNSSDETKSVVEDFMPLFNTIKLEYVFEGKQGKVFAFNTGVMRSKGDLFSGIDDDIEIAKDWLVEVERVFQERWNEIDFVGGKMLPNWEVQPPSWIEPLKEGVIGWRDYGEKDWFYTWDTTILSGGHAVFKRSVFDEIGLLPEQIGPIGKNLIGCEDDVIFHKLMSKNIKGIYCSKLVFYHYVPEYRLSKSYYRQWCFGAGISKYLMDKHFERIDGTRIFDIPRWMFRNFIFSIYEKVKYSLLMKEDISLAKENPILVFAGFFYARHLQDSFVDKPLQLLTKFTIKPAQR
jgi:glucosyl-dolichyl phosphate glucuronosyltransferase